VKSQFIKDRERSRPNLGKPRRPCAAAEPRIIHSPNFDCSIIPHLGLFRWPTFRAVCIAIKPQNVDVRIAFGSRQLGLRNPHFQFSIFEWNDFADGASWIDWRPGRKQDQMVGQMTEKHRN
jgi:hypothetical protein